MQRAVKVRKPGRCADGDILWQFEQVLYQVVALTDKHTQIKLFRGDFYLLSILGI